MALVAGLLALELSGSAGRIVGTDHANYLGFYSTVQGGEELCQTGVDLPAEAAAVRMEIGTYGAPLPDLALSFLDSAGKVVARGSLPAGGAQGIVSIPLSYPHGPTVAGRLCVRPSGSGMLALAGETWPAGSVGDSEVEGTSQGGRIGLFYVSRPQSWWALLPRLSERLGFGKAGFGSWTLILAAIAMIAVWVLVGRLLARELS